MGADTLVVTRVFSRDLAHWGEHGSHPTFYVIQMEFYDYMTNTLYLVPVFAIPNSAMLAIVERKKQRHTSEAGAPGEWCALVW